jgi:phage terminase small subunit
MRELNPKQLRFCEEYIIDGNGTQSAIRAGYSEKTAYSIAENLLSKVEIQAKVAELKAVIADKLSLSAERVLWQYMQIVDYRLADIMDFDGVEAKFKPLEEWPQSAKVAVSGIKQTITERKDFKEVKIEFKIDDRQKALEAIGRYLGMFDPFESALRTLKTYGLNLVRGEDGSWSVVN